MTTLLEKTLRRALKINGAEYVLTISPEGLKLTLKKKRKGLELTWADLVSGEAALATALNASLGDLSAPNRNPKPIRNVPPRRENDNVTPPGRSRRGTKPRSH